MILGPEFPHAAKDAGSAARKEALAILESRGNSPRSYRNTLVMLAADSNRLRELQSAVRQFLAWDSIWDDRETLNLDPFQTKQAETKLRTSDETVDARIPETFQWLLVPGQSDPKGDIEWTEIRLQGQDSLAVRAAKKLKNEELLMVELGDVRLRHELDRVPLWRGNHVGVKQLAEDMAKYLYLPRLRDDDVLLGRDSRGCCTSSHSCRRRLPMPNVGTSRRSDTSAWPPAARFACCWRAKACWSSPTWPPPSWRPTRRSSPGRL